MRTRRETTKLTNTRKATAIEDITKSITKGLEPVIGRIAAPAIIGAVVAPKTVGMAKPTTAGAEAPKTCPWEELLPEELECDICGKLIINSKL